MPSLIASHRGTHDPVFTQTVRVPSNQDCAAADVRFALYDVDQDDRILEEELVGEVVVHPSEIANGQTLTLPLSKGGRPVLDAFITLNPPTATAAGTAVESKRGGATAATAAPAVVKFEVQVSARGFPILSTNDAMVAASLRDPKTSRLVFVGQTERLP